MHVTAATTPHWLKCILPVSLTHNATKHIQSIFSVDADSKMNFSNQ